MFEKFGELNSIEELNAAAQGMREEGDRAGVLSLAEENGVPTEVAEVYLAGKSAQMCMDAELGAQWKLDAEEADLKPQGLMVDWINYIRGLCEDDESMARAVRKKGKSVKGCIGALMAWGMTHMQVLDKEIASAAAESAGFKGRRPSAVSFGIPGMGEAKKIIREYYTKEVQA